MKLKDAKDAVLKLMDEYSSGGVITSDEDLEKRLNSLFDLAQKMLSSIAPIRRKIEVNNKGFVAYPSNMLKLQGVYADGQLTDVFVMGGGFYIFQEDNRSYVIDALVFPAEINAQTDDNYEFEVNDSAVPAIIYWVAAQLASTEIAGSYNEFIRLYNEALKTVVPTAFTGNARVVV